MGECFLYSQRKGDGVIMKMEKTNEQESAFPGQELLKDYIHSQDEHKREILWTVHEAIFSLVPRAEVTLSWRMPTYKLDKNLIHFSAFKNHYGLYPGPDAVEAFQDQLEGRKCTKGAIKFSYGESVPVDLIQEITRWCLKHGLTHGQRMGK